MSERQADYRVKHHCHDGELLKDALHLRADYLRKDQEGVWPDTFCGWYFGDPQTTSNLDDATCPNCELYLDLANEQMDALSKLDKYDLLTELCKLAAGDDYDSDFTPHGWAVYRYAFERMKELL